MLLLIILLLILLFCGFVRADGGAADGTRVPCSASSVLESKNAQMGDFAYRDLSKKQQQ